MSGGNPYVPRKESVQLGKFILVLSFFLPYIFAYPNYETFMSFMIYAPNWVLQERSSILYAGFTPVALIMFQFWLPYAFIGIQAYRYAKGRISSEKSYLLNVILLTIVAVIFVIPLSLMPSGGTGTEDVYTTYIPLPLISVIAFLSARRLAPTRVDSPWTEDTDKIKSEGKEESVWLD